ncbi:P-loop containing nucleoside triphosphate hydrolase protein [Diplogelasinospora grovesii]|uniref:P-loop containing nucleoside triphosphate hydrolase protein n=1 Tax=Diplogelasinospora grovesii TaxID=303347 RepID=A0AAN6S698_9PEZI|nr:P-loop containing nucleoside triphosphate hydrolase protein [Diplogelasinospora grovesii]
MQRLPVLPLLRYVLSLLPTLFLLVLFIPPLVSRLPILRLISDWSLRFVQRWKLLPELPQSDEILTAGSKVDQLPENPVDTEWASKDAYLAAQYQILRRDGIESLRSSVRGFINASRGRQEVRDDDKTCIYTQVRVTSYIMAKEGPVVRVAFATRYRIQWEQSERLRPGTLVALSTKTDNFNKICKVAAVHARPYQGGLDQSPPLVDLMWAKPEDAIFDPALELVMVESRNGYFEAARHTLVGLQQASTTDSPLDKYITGRHRVDTPPAFLQEDPIMDLSSIAHGSSGSDVAIAGALSTFNVLSDRLPDIEGKTSLDRSQLESVHRIISKELAIVQGPPGTGKTFTSVEAIKIMVATRRKRGGPPVVVAAQTNHALDRLLALCLDAGAKILRVGGRTQCARIQEHTLYEIRKRRASAESKALASARRTNIEEFQLLVDRVFGDELLAVDGLLEAGIITEQQCQSLRDEHMKATDRQKHMGPFSRWLGDDLVAAPSLRDLYPARSDLQDVETWASSSRFDFDDDFKDAPYDDVGEYRTSGREVKLTHAWSTKEPAHSRPWDQIASQELASKSNLFDIDDNLRGAVYRYLRAEFIAALTPKLVALLAKDIELAGKVKADACIEDARRVAQQRIDVVGCTTTGLTKFRGILGCLQPRSLLIEEAAETLEANITSALYPSLQQLILVGDHQQLAPSCSISWLGEKPYNLNVSLFQRLVNLKMPYTMLMQQRRMKRELRLVLTPFYPQLTDSPEVLSPSHRPDIPGMGGRNLWFFHHTWPEATDSGRSKFNGKEAGMISHFFAYLVDRGTPAEKITVLTFYNGQRKVLLGKLRRHRSLLRLTTFNVCTIDSYQGEENDVIILSLVRSPDRPDARSLGFLEDERRAVVAVSRARRGFYLFGNADSLVLGSYGAGRLWERIHQVFATQHRINRLRGLPIVCQQHNQTIWVKEIADWTESAAGCGLTCRRTRSCGHRCTHKCHSIPHDRLPCTKTCRKKLECGHGCCKLCHEECVCRCDRFRMWQVRQHSHAQHIAEVAADDIDKMSLAQRLLALGAEPNTLIRRGLDYCDRSPSSTADDSSGDMHSINSVSSQASNPQSTPAQGIEIGDTYRRNTRQHDEGLEDTTTSTSSSIIRFPVIRETYQPTSLDIEGRRVEVGKKAVCCVQPSCLTSIITTPAGSLKANVAKLSESRLSNIPGMQTETGDKEPDDESKGLERGDEAAGIGLAGTAGQGLGDFSLVGDCV